MYETLHQQNSAFSPDIPGLQLVWDNTSMSLFKTCPRKYQLTMLDGWKSKRPALPLTFGILYHAALEHYDIAKSSGATHEEAVRVAVRVALQDSRTEDNKPWETDCSKRNLLNLVRAVVWYLDHFETDPCQTLQLDNGQPAVELTFKFALPEPELDHWKPLGEYMLSGHLDRVVSFCDEIYVQDRKTTAGYLTDNYFRDFDMSGQMSQYTYAANVVLKAESARGVIIDAVQLGVGFARFQRGITSRTPRQLSEWHQSTCDALQYLETLVQRTADYAAKGIRYDWPMNVESCDKYAGCVFRDICSKDAAVRSNFLKSDFKKEIWNPAQSR